MKQFWKLICLLILAVVLLVSCSDTSSDSGDVSASSSDTSDTEAATEATSVTTVPNGGGDVVWNTDDSGNPPSQIRFTDSIRDEDLPKADWEDPDA